MDILSLLSSDDDDAFGEISDTSREISDTSRFSTSANHPVPADSNRTSGAYLGKSRDPPRQTLPTLAHPLSTPQLATPQPATPQSCALQSCALQGVMKTPAPPLTRPASTPLLPLPRANALATPARAPHLVQGLSAPQQQHWQQSPPQHQQQRMQPKPSVAQSSGLQSSGLQSSGLQSSGLQSSGLQSSVLQSSGLQSSGLQSSGRPSSLTAEQQARIAAKKEEALAKKRAGESKLPGASKLPGGSKLPAPGPQQRTLSFALRATVAWQPTAAMQGQGVGYSQGGGGHVAPVHQLHQRPAQLRQQPVVRQPTRSCSICSAPCAQHDLCNICMDVLDVSMRDL